MSEQEFISPQSKRLHVTTLDTFPESWLILIIDSFSLSILVDLFCHISWFDDLPIFCSLVTTQVLFMGFKAPFV